jgi:hypothetical protein
MLRRVARDVASALASHSRCTAAVASAGSPRLARSHVIDEIPRADAGIITRTFAKASRRAPRRVSPGAATDKALQPMSAAWTEVADPRTGRSYWWNKATGQTTALGDARPDEYRLPEVYRGNQLTRPFDAEGRPTLGLAMGQMMVFGFGGALGVTFVSAVIAWVSGGAGMEAAAAAVGPSEVATALPPPAE